MPHRLATVLTSFVLFTSVIAASAADNGQRLPVRLRFNAPAECPNRNAFFHQLQTRSTRIREAEAGESAPSIRVELRPRDDGQVLGTLVASPLGGPIEQQAGRREILGADCESVAQGLALIAVVILDPSATLSADVAPSAPTAVQAAPLKPQPPSVPTRVLAGPSPSSRLSSYPEQTSRRAHMSIGAALEAVAGQGPDIVFLPRAFLELELPAPIAKASARLSVGRGYPASVDTAVGTAQITLTDVRFEPCVDVGSTGALRVGTCGIVEGLVLSGQGTNTNLPKNESRTIFELGLGLRPVWAVSEEVTVGLLLAAAVPLARYRFYFMAPDTTAYRLSAWSGLGEFSVSVRFL